jgi:hypothetical protein
LRFARSWESSLITLAATNTLQGSAGTATAVTYTITGMTLSSTQVETYAVLAQGQLAVSAGVLYTVPAGTSALVKEILLANTTASAVANVKLFVNGTAATNQIASINIPANGEAKFDHTGWAVYDGNGSLQTSNIYVAAPAGSVPETSVANLSTDFAIVASALANNGVDSGCQVTFVSGLNVAIAAGVVRINGNRYNIAAVASQAITAADANYQRWDLITANTSSAVVYTAGTAAAYPVLPAIPANSVVLAAVLMNAGNNPALSSSSITDKRIILGSVNINLERVVDPSVALKVFRGAVANKDLRPVDVLFLGDSIHEGYYASEDRKRYIYLINKRLQTVYNPQHVPGGEGFIPAYHNGNGTGASPPPLGGFILPQRWTWTGPNLPPSTYFTDSGYGLSRRAANYSAQTQSASIANLLCDRFWLYYTSLTTTGWMGIAVDAKRDTVATQGVLSGTATGTFTTTTTSGWPGGTFTLTVDDEDMTVTANGGTITITARGANATTAVTHAVGNTVLWAPAGVTRLNTTGAATKSGRRWDSGALTRGMHSITVVPINRAGGGGTWNIIVDGVMVFDGDGNASPATFTDGILVGTTTTGVQALPTGTINVASTTNFPASGSATIVTSAGAQAVSYTGVGAGTLTGCTGGTGNTSAGGAVTSMTLQSATAAFTAADVGKAIYGAGIQQTSTITTVSSATQVILSAPGTITGTGIVLDINGRGAGVRMWEAAHSAYASSSWMGPAGTTAGYWADALDTADPDLVVIELGVVDLLFSISPLTYVANMVNVVNLINSKCASPPSIVFFIPWTPDQTVASNQAWPSFVNAMYLLANQFGATIFDFGTKFTPATSTGANATNFGDMYHPNDAGHTNIAHEFTRFLIGDELPVPIRIPWFGDGVDGTLVYDGTTTILGMAPAANVYTLTRDIFATNMTVNNGVTIKTAGFRIYCTGILSTPVSGTGIIDNSGGNAVANAAGAATATGTTAGSVAGGAGGASSTAGGAGVGYTALNGPIMGGNGGIGGASTGAAGAAGATANSSLVLNARTIHSTTTGMAMQSAQSATKFQVVQGGQGGGGGGGGSSTGGGGGAGGGIIVICANTMAFMGTISANGGNGGNSTNGAGGGGGGGGCVYITTGNLGSQGAVTVTGGNPGTGTAGAPATGAAGNVIIQRA